MTKQKTAMRELGYIPAKPKSTRQGAGANTKYAATSRNSARKKYRGQGT